VLKLLCGDSENILKTFQDNYIDVFISDIPYGVGMNPNWDKGMPSVEIWKECYRILKPGSHCVLFGQPSMIMELMSIMSKTDFEYRDMWIWSYQGTHTKGYKTADGYFRNRIRNVYNPIFVYRKKLEGTEEINWDKYRTNLFNIDASREPYKGDHEAITKKFNETGLKHFQSRTPSNTFKTLKPKGWVPNPKGAEPTNIKYVPRATTFEKTIGGKIINAHETVKPIKLMLWLVNLLTNNENQIVMDAFMGTGSTGCACKILNRNFIGIDNDKVSFDIASFRIDHVDEIISILK
jgi:site-specific DNA-methyltransferase (adenine-specific)